MKRLRPRLVILALLLTGVVIFASCKQDNASETTNPIPGDYPHWIQRNKSINETIRPVELVFLGDSLTEFWVWDWWGIIIPNRIWDHYYGNRQAANFGIAGDRIQYLLWRIENGNFYGINPKLIVLLIGTNNLQYNSSSDIAAGIKKVVFTLRKMEPQSNILLLGIFPRGEKADDPLRAKIIETNRLLIPMGYTPNVTYLDVGQIFLAENGTISSDIMFDYLHLTAYGYELLAQEINPTVRRLLR